MVLSELFDYQLPEDLIAQRPAATRDDARLMVVDPAGFQHTTIPALTELVPEGALMVLNRTRVRRARLLGQRAVSGGRVELLLLEARADGLWLALGRANRPLKSGDRVVVGELAAVVVRKQADGTLLLRLETTEREELALDKHGLLPLPPYIQRKPDQQDDERYQTVFAEELGSVAAPTASLHLSSALLKRLQAERGVELGFLTLHVGVGTFRPVTAPSLDEHAMHEEHMHVSASLVAALQRARRAGRPVVAVGTTVVRALETAAASGEIREFHGPTRLFIRPGYSFQVVDCLMTNFHMPKSTLLALVAAFAGEELTLRAYRVALERAYRFLSYGDAMWIGKCHARST